MTQRQAYKEISQKIRQFFFNGTHVTVDKLTTLLTDVIFLYGIDLSARLQSAKSNGRTFYAD